MDLRSFWSNGVQGTAELDYSEALDTMGLRFKASGERQGRAWIGATTRNDGGRLLVTQVRRETPAYAAGLNVDEPGAPQQLTLDETVQKVREAVAAAAPPRPSSPFASIQNQEDAPPCSTCGSIMVRNGSCYKCVNCGTTSGCA